MANPLSWEQLSENVLTTVIGYALGGAITPVIAPLTQEASNYTWSNKPVMPLSPADLANMVVQNIMQESDAAIEAAKSGIDTDPFHKLVLVNGSPIAPDQALDLWNRGEISEDDVTRALLQSRLKPEWVDTFKRLRVQILQVADLASMVVQNVLTESEGADGAAKLGYSADDFNRLVRLSGNPPGPEAMLELWNRGEISEDDVTTALLQSRLKPEWVDTFKLLRERPLSASTAVEAVLRQRIGHDEGVALAAKQGMSASDFDIALETSGRAMGVMEALTLARRGDFTYDDFEAVVARSDVKTEYAPDIWKLKEALPGITQVRAMIHANAIPDALAHEILLKEGYSEDLAKATIDAGHSTKTQGTKDVAAGTIEVLYVAGLDSHELAMQALEKLGYDAQESEQYLQVWTARRIASELVHGVGVIRSRYTTWKITAVTARADLNDFGLDHPTIERLVGWWTDERVANKPQLTHGMVTTGFKYGRYTYDEATQLLLSMGWDAADALTLLWNTVHGDPRPGASTTTPGTPVTVTPPPPGFSGVDTTGTT